MRLPELRAALLARPDDLGLRLVYADLLTERGDPRGLFIQAQVSGDHGVADQLLANYQAHFLYPLPLASEVHFENGLIHTWRTDPNGFRQSGRRLLRYQPLQCLCVSHLREVDLRYVLDSVGLELVEQLEFPEARGPVWRHLGERTLPRLRHVTVTGSWQHEGGYSFRQTPMFRQLAKSSRAGV
jgi:uncharacterized protein (TIGR02996 family)